MSYGVGITLLGLAILSSAAAAASLAKPHIVVILADDLGWNDVSFHGSDQIPTPNIDALAYNGVILNNHYTPALCTPSRAALMTGKYPIHTGMQHLVILEPEPWGLPLSERLLPQHLQNAGYRTHAVGKWHLGFYRKEYTPTFRGFDTHFGYWQGFQDYFNHSIRATFEPTMDGYDMRRGLNVDWGSRGKYSTEVFTEEGVRLIREHDASAGPMFLYLAHLAPHTGNIREPFQAPDEAIARFTHIQDPERRVYAAMVSKLDESVGEVVAALRAKGMLDNSIIVFMSDNGAPTHGIHSNRGSNYPLRGIKDTPWEGGQRTVAAIWSPLLHRRQRVSNHLMYMADWLPTLYSAAGLDVADLGNIDGYNMWPSISDDIPSPRTDLVYNIDDVGQEYAAIRKDDWKYITGSVGQGHKELWYGENGRKDSIGYNIHQVLSSRTATTLAGFTTKQQIKEKVSYINVANERSQWRLLNRNIILRLRQSAELICTKSNTTSMPINDCHPLEAPCLFNIRDDPCEYVNLAPSHPLVVHSLEESLARYRKGVVKARNKPAEASANPIFWNNTWSCWHDEIDRAALELYPRSNILLLAISILFIITAFVSLLGLMLRYPLQLAALPQSTKIISIFRISGTEEELNTKKKTVH